jgi:hypothetical protein
MGLRVNLYSNHIKGEKRNSSGTRIFDQKGTTPISATFSTFWARALILSGRGCRGDPSWIPIGMIPQKKKGKKKEKLPLRKDQAFIGRSNGIFGLCPKYMRTFLCD